jgi:hypothetical protein
VSGTLKAWRLVALAALVVAWPLSLSAAEVDKTILDRAEHHKDNALRLWERLVNVDSQTDDAPGLNAVAAIAI